MKKMLTFVSMLALLMFCGCQTVEMVDRANDKGAAVADLDYRDFDNAANKMINDLIATGSLNKPAGGRYVVAISRVVNDTTQNIDVDQLIKKIRTSMLRSGKAVITTAVGAKGPEDAMSYQARELAADANFNQATVAGKGQMIAPELSLSGKILERRVAMSGRKTQIEYYFQLSLTQISTGLALWEAEEQIIKRQRR